MNRSRPEAAVLLGMGGPAGLDDVQPFLTALFSDRAIMPLPDGVRQSVAKLIAGKRAPHSSERYRLLGGSSPIHGFTAEQARMLEESLGEGWIARYCFRYSEPHSGEVVRDLLQAGVRRAVLVSTYPQRSWATIDSSVAHFLDAARPQGLHCRVVTNYPVDAGYIGALARLTGDCLQQAGPGATVVMSAHGLPRRSVRKGDPYVREVQATARALARSLPPGVPWHLAYQSRVGPVRWVGPGLEQTLARLGQEGVDSVVVVPLSFTSEHLETLIELDLEMREKAAEAGIGGYVRVGVPGLQPDFIEMLARLARREVARA